jgi:hypothetical protein
MYDFIGLVLPRMDRAAIDAMMAGDAGGARSGGAGHASA